MRKGFEASSSLPSSSSPRTSASASSSFVRVESGGGGQNLEERVVKLAEALAVLGGKGDRVAEAEAEGLVGAVAPRCPLRLVGDDDDRLVRRAGRPRRNGGRRR